MPRNRKPPAQPDIIRQMTREEVIEVWEAETRDEMRAEGYSDAEIDEMDAEFSAYIKQLKTDPERWQKFLDRERRLAKLSPSDREEIYRQTDALMAERIRLEGPPPDVKLWTGAEDVRRERHESGDPDCPGR